MAETKKTQEEKRLFEDKLKAIRADLPANPVSELHSFCRYTQRDAFDTEHVYNVLRKPIRRYDDEILTALERMVKFNKVAA